MIPPQKKDDLCVSDGLLRTWRKKCTTQEADSTRGFCDVVKMMMIKKNNLAKSGYTLGIKVGKKKNKQNLSIFFLGYLLELIIKNLAIPNLKKKKSKIWRIWAVFFHGKSFCVGRNHIFEAKNLMIKRNIAPDIWLMGACTRVRPPLSLKFLGRKGGWQIRICTCTHSLLTFLAHSSNFLFLPQAICLKENFIQGQYLSP